MTLSMPSMLALLAPIDKDAGDKPSLWDGSEDPLEFGSMLGALEDAVAPKKAPSDDVLNHGVGFAQLPVDAPAPMSLGALAEGSRKGSTLPVGNGTALQTVAVPETVAKTEGFASNGIPADVRSADAAKVPESGDVPSPTSRSDATTSGPMRVRSVASRDADNSALWRELSDAGRVDLQKIDHENRSMAYKSKEASQRAVASPSPGAVSLSAAEDLEAPPARSSADSALLSVESAVVGAGDSSMLGGDAQQGASRDSGQPSPGGRPAAQAGEADLDAFSPLLARKAAQTAARVEIDAQLAVEVAAGDAGIEITLEGTKTVLDDLRGVDLELETALERDGERLSHLNYRDRGGEDGSRQRADAKASSSTPAENKTENEPVPVVEHGTMINAVA